MLWLSLWRVHGLRGHGVFLSWGWSKMHEVLPGIQCVQTVSVFLFVWGILVVYWQWWCWLFLSLIHSEIFPSSYLDLLGLLFLYRGLSGLDMPWMEVAVGVCPKILDYICKKVNSLCLKIFLHVGGYSWDAQCLVILHFLYCGHDLLSVWWFSWFSDFGSLF